MPGLLWYSDVCLEAKSGLEDLAFALTTACPTPGPTLQGRSAAAASSFTGGSIQLVASRGWGDFGGTDSPS